MMFHWLKRKSPAPASPAESSSAARVNSVGYSVAYAVGEKREEFGAYKYQIFKDGRFVADFWHDFKGDDHWIRFANGQEDEWPAGLTRDFLTGGGPQPLGLTDKAVKYLDEHASAR
ncbi:MAG: hypothetical protein ABIY52_08670 [Gemmatimonadaceae bacterium]